MEQLLLFSPGTCHAMSCWVITVVCCSITRSHTLPLPAESVVVLLDDQPACCRLLLFCCAGVVKEVAVLRLLSDHPSAVQLQQVSQVAWFPGTAWTNVVTVPLFMTFMTGCKHTEHTG